jgi:hypothetical protein
MADPNYNDLTAPQKAVVDAAVEWQAAELNFVKPSGQREAAPDGGNKDAHAQNRTRSAETKLRVAVRNYNEL